MLQWLQGIQKTTVVRRNLNLQALDSRCLSSCCLASWQQMLLPGLETFRHPIDTSSLAHTVSYGILQDTTVCRNLQVAQNCSKCKRPFMATISIRCTSASFLRISFSASSCQGMFYSQFEVCAGPWITIIELEMIRTCNSARELYRISDTAPHKNHPCPSLLVPSFYEPHPVLAWRKNANVMLFRKGTCPSCLSYLIFQVPNFGFTHFVLQSFYPNSGINSDLTSRIWRFVSSTCPQSYAANHKVPASPYYPFGQSCILALLKVFPSRWSTGGQNHRTLRSSFNIISSNRLRS